MRTALLGAALTVTAALASTTPPAHATTTTAATGTGASAAGSTKFTGDTIDAALMATGPGCGTQAGQTKVDATMVFTLAH